MRFAFLDVMATVSPGGLQTVVWEVSRELARRGFGVSIFGGRGTVVNWQMKNLKVHMLPFLRREWIPDLGKRFRKLGERLSFGVFAFHAMKKDPHDYLFIFKPFDFPLAGLVKRTTSATIVFFSGGTDFYPLDQRFVRSVDVFLSCTHFNAWQIYRRYKVYPTVVYHGVDPEVFKPIPPDAEVRQRLGIGPHETVLIYAGRLEGLKGVHHILEALSLDHLAQEKVTPLIIGGGTYEETLKALSKKLGLDNRVKFLGFVPHRELPRYYSVAHLAVYPSIGDEAFGLSIAEAMACGIPVIATHLGGIPEVVGTDERCGILVPPRESSALAEGILKLIGDGDLRERMGFEARKRVVEHFTWKKVTDQILKRLGIAA